jgi:Fe-S oxidoreductase
VDENPSAEILWWVGCAPCADSRARDIARALARLLIHAGVNFAVLGDNEHCTGDAARRAGKEDIFYQLATTNVEIINKVNPKRIVTACPHCLHTLMNEYPAYGGHYTVIHHTQLITELQTSGLLPTKPTNKPSIQSITYHDPCYLGRINHIYTAPRQILTNESYQFIEMNRNRADGFCCGAGGAQMWKEEEHGNQPVRAHRLKQAEQTGADRLALGCPFCKIMLTDAASAANSKIEPLDLAEIVAEWIE